MSSNSENNPANLYKLHIQDEFELEPILEFELGLGVENESSNWREPRIRNEFELESTGVQFELGYQQVSTNIKKTPPRVYIPWTGFLLIFIQRR